MFARVSCVLLWIFSIIFHLETCTGELAQTYLSLYSPGDPEYTDVIVRNVGDNLTLACELKGDIAPIPRIYVWNYVPSANSTEDEKVYKTEPRGPALGSRLTKPDLQEFDSGHYVCSAPPYSVTKYILVQPKSTCARGAIWCGHCVLGTYVCDGFVDCPRGEDENPRLCLPNVCSRPDKLNCSTGRCVSEAACCRAPAALCKQPACCDEHAPYSRQQGWADEYPPLFEDRHAPDEYGFIQSTIYTVTDMLGTRTVEPVQPSRIGRKRIFILGPSHHVRLGGCALSAMDKYQTPLYDLTIDKQIYSELEASRAFTRMDAQTDEDEHSIEMHLPYIAKVMEEYKTGFTIIPILVGSLSPEKEAKYGAILAPYLADPQNLVVISSDFCHWGQRFRYTWRDQARGPIHQSIEWLDKQGMDIIEKRSPREFTEYLNKYGNTICGRHPIGVLLQAVACLEASPSPPRAALRFLKYAQSSQCENLHDSSVSYASASLVLD